MTRASVVILTYRTLFAVTLLEAAVALYHGLLGSSIIGNEESHARQIERKIEVEMAIGVTRGRVKV